ncbi:hypothetical protein ACWDT5_20650 [Rhodococcus aetherivorans]|nr:MULTISPECIES: hypothetical protein [Rhodococcus]WKW96532.1 hypothetical protein Q3O43_15745 [Rhodococcus aetherivorans]
MPSQLRERALRLHRESEPKPVIRRLVETLNARRLPGDPFSLVV